jgi:hypothetical protein
MNHRRRCPAAARALLLLGLLCAAACSSSQRKSDTPEVGASHGTGGPGGAGSTGPGSTGPGAGSPGEACGPKTCPAGQVCCNQSCGICTPPGGVCTQQFCESSAPPTTNPGGGMMDPGAACKVDGDCRAFADYCTGCDCRALGKTEKDPPCAGPGVRCIADPCRDRAAACQGGHCVLKTTRQ